MTSPAAAPATFEAHASKAFVYEGVPYFEGETFPREGVADPVMVRRLHGARMIDWGKAPADLAAIGKLGRAEFEQSKAPAAPPADVMTEDELEAATAPARAEAEPKQRGKRAG